MSCQRCKSERVLNIQGKCSDLCNWDVGDKEGDGYVPSGVNLAGGDYIGFEVCLECGQIQGTWPVPDPEDS